MTIQFSIATPTRNALHYLQRCVGSVRAQEGVTLEHIVQDACSTDGTSAWLATQPDLRSTTEPDNSMYDGINRAWMKSEGEILSWLNSDEQYLPGTLALVARHFEQNPHADFLYGNYIVVDAKGEGIAARREIRLSKFYLANGFLTAVSCTLFFRRRLFNSGMLNFDTHFRYASDMDLILRLLNAGKQPLRVNQYLALFTFDGGNLSCSPKMIEETEAIREKFGGHSHGLKRRMAQLGRIAERCIAGSYWTRTVSYDYVIDAESTTRRVEARSLPPSYVTQ